MKRYHGVSPLEQKRSMPAWLAKPLFRDRPANCAGGHPHGPVPQFIAPTIPSPPTSPCPTRPPSAAHWFGTDFYGRDIFSRVIWGTRIDLLIGVLGVVIPFLVGGMIGLLAGYYGGFLDSLLMRITDIMMAFPFTILVITIMAILGQGLINLFIALWLVGWMSYAKLVRSEVLVLKDSEFIQAARVAGFSDARILFRHLLPNVISSAVVFAASDVVMCMLTGRVHELPGPGCFTPYTGVGLHPQRGPHLHHLRLVAHPVPSACSWPSAASASPCWGRPDRLPAHERTVSPAWKNYLKSVISTWPSPASGRPSAPWTASPSRSSRGDLRPGGRVGLRQEPDPPLHPGPAEAARPDHRRRNPLQGADIAKMSQRELQKSGARRSHDLPGAHDRLNPVLRIRSQMYEAFEGEKLSKEEKRRRAIELLCWWASPPPRPGWMSIPTSSPAACASAP